MLYASRITRAYVDSCNVIMREIDCHQLIHVLQNNHVTVEEDDPLVKFFLAR